MDALFVMLFAGNFPWLHFLMTVLPFETKIHMAMSLLREAAKQAVQERRKENKHRKV